MCLRHMMLVYRIPQKQIFNVSSNSSILAAGGLCNSIFETFDHILRSFSQSDFYCCSAPYYKLSSKCNPWCDKAFADRSGIALRVDSCVFIGTVTRLSRFFDQLDGVSFFLTSARLRPPQRLSLSRCCSTSALQLGTLSPHPLGCQRGYCFIACFLLLCVSAHLPRG